ncbi:EAL domain-containing protein [Ideonella sp. B508-1]|uniref:EAL domain-containing response regulator n=1 Tax=Ideonella sp. B508-1 TaxID=137716 RepID=UPI0003B4283F|nr:EAL domain-containing response regulator [Ideonella sp. B508-1]
MPGGYPSVLVVDDSLVQRQHAAMLCRELGMDLVYEASDGREALALLSMLVLPPSLLIVDLEMPGMDGFEFLEELHRLQVFLPVLIASSREQMLMNSANTLGKELGLPMVATLAKPLCLTQLREALTNRLPQQAGRARPAPLPLTAGDLDTALREHALKVHYQPKVDMHTGLLRGVEALARWTHPVLGPIPPDQFIPLAEQSDLIEPLTLSVLDQALAQTAAWQTRGLNLSLAINLSPRLLESPTLVEHFSAQVAQHGLDPHQLMIEITEGSLAKRLDVALNRLARLRLRGFGLSIDDYGTGFSSMQQLARIPFTELKIDRSFVSEATQRPHLQVILRSALEMAHQLGLVSVAEGIETLQDWRLLQTLGCQIGQGWLIAKAMPGDDLHPWLRGHRQRLALLRAEPEDLAAPTQQPD